MPYTNTLLKRKFIIDLVDELLPLCYKVSYGDASEATKTITVLRTMLLSGCSPQDTANLKADIQARIEKFNQLKTAYSRISCELYDSWRELETYRENSPLFQYTEDLKEAQGFLDKLFTWPANSPPPPIRTQSGRDARRLSVYNFTSSLDKKNNIMEGFRRLFILFRCFVYADTTPVKDILYTASIIGSTFEACSNWHLVEVASTSGGRDRVYSDMQTSLYLKYEGEFMRILNEKYLGLLHA